MCVCVCVYIYIYIYIYVYVCICMCCNISSQYNLLTVKIVSNINIQFKKTVFNKNNPQIIIIQIIIIIGYYSII